MNIYNLYSRPEELNDYDRADKRVPKLIHDRGYREHDGDDTTEGHEDLDRLKRFFKNRSHHLAKDPEFHRWYVDLINDGERWPEGEEYLMKSPYLAAQYAKFKLHGRWKEAEPYIAKDPKAAMYYADFVIKGKWADGEEAILKGPPADIFRYAVYVLMKRWPDAEPILAKAGGLPKSDYENVFKIKL